MKFKYYKDSQTERMLASSQRMFAETWDYS